MSPTANEKEKLGHRKLCQKMKEHGGNINIAKMNGKRERERETTNGGEMEQAVAEACESI